jgi:hypothetical protein
MQTFLPYPSYSKSAQVLDRQRLGKQRVEAYQILRILLGHTQSKAWANHPATKMWRGHSGPLASYGLHMCEEWMRRGYKDTLWSKIHTMLDEINSQVRSTGSLSEIHPPWWLGEEILHESHRAALLFKNPQHYGQYGWEEKPIIAYYWPV